jgi:very-short-patch-repair endonuclease
VCVGATVISRFSLYGCSNLQQYKHVNPDKKIEIKNVKNNRHTRMSAQFTHDLELLLPIFKTRKDPVVYYLKKHFQENIHFICYRDTAQRVNRYGGSSKQIFMLTQETFELIENTYNLKHRYVTKINSTTNHVNSIMMSIENASIGFICNCIDGVIEHKRQFKVDKYFVDLYLPKINVVIECDELNHRSYDQEEEKTRETFITETLDEVPSSMQPKVAFLKCKFIRFNPTSPNFDLSTIINHILKLSLKK